MVLQLVKDKITGIYKYQEIGKPTTPVIDTSAYDAYTGGQKTTLATGTGATTDIGQQTESILRETPGQVSFNPQTGTIEQKDSEGKKIGVDTITDISTTGEQTEMMETPIEKAARIAAMTGGTGSQVGQMGFDDSLIRRQQDLQERAQKINTITKTADLGLQAYRAYKGISKAGTLSTTPLTGGTFGGSTFMSGAGGAAVAGGLGYGVSKILGGDAKQNRAGRSRPRNARKKSKPNASATIFMWSPCLSGQHQSDCVCQAPQKAELVQRTSVAPHRVEMQNRR